MTLRFFRLYPLHLAVTLAFLALVLAKQFVLPAFTSMKPSGPLQDDFGVALLLNVLLLHSMGLTSYAILNAPSWSISAELWTYVVFALVCVTLRRSVRRVAMMCLIGIAGISIVLAFTGDRGLATYIDYGFPRCLASFGLGTFVWLLVDRAPLRLSRLAQDFALVVSLAAVAVFLAFTSSRTPANAFAPLLFAVVIYLCGVDRGSSVKSVLECSALKALGRWSYSIYMVHLMIAVLMMNVVERVWRGHVEIEGFTAVSDVPLWIGDGLVMLYLALVIGVSALTYRFIESPWREFGRHLARGRSGQAKPSPGETAGVR
jgi:peptidoglycan/LPS O-acetylase OafA/YrhL